MCKHGWEIGSNFGLNCKFLGHFCSDFLVRSSSPIRLDLAPAAFSYGPNFPLIGPPPGSSSDAVPKTPVTGNFGPATRQARSPPPPPVGVVPACLPRPPRPPAPPPGQSTSAGWRRPLAPLFCRQLRHPRPPPGPRGPAHLWHGPRLAAAATAALRWPGCSFCVPPVIVFAGGWWGVREDWPRWHDTTFSTFHFQQK